MELAGPQDIHQAVPSEPCWVAEFTPLGAELMVDLVGPIVESDQLPDDAEADDVAPLASDSGGPEALVAVGSTSHDDPLEEPVHTDSVISTEATSGRSLLFRGGVGVLVGVAFILAIGQFDYRQSGSSNGESAGRLTVASTVNEPNEVDEASNDDRDQSETSPRSTARNTTPSLNLPTSPGRVAEGSASESALVPPRPTGPPQIVTNSQPQLTQQPVTDEVASTTKRSETTQVPSTAKRPATTQGRVSTERPATTRRSTTTQGRSTTQSRATTKSPVTTQRSATTERSRSTDSSATTQRPTTVRSTSTTRPTSSPSNSPVTTQLPVTQPPPTATPILIEYRDDVYRDGFVAAATDGGSVSIADTVLGVGGDGIEGVVIDAYIADDAGRRYSYVASAETDADGNYQLTITNEAASGDDSIDDAVAQSGCYVLVFLAPEGFRFEASGQFREALLCSPKTAADLPLVRMAEPTDARRGTSMTSAVFADGVFYLRGSGSTSKLYTLGASYIQALGLDRIVVEYDDAGGLLGEGFATEGLVEPIYIKGETASSSGLVFQSGTATLSPIATKVLDDVTTLLSVNPEARLAIEIGSDPKLGEQSESQLLESRADSVVDYLGKVGIERDRYDVLLVVGDLDGRRFLGHAYSNQLGLQINWD